MTFIFYLFFSCITVFPGQPAQEVPEIKIVKELFRLRNEGKADSAEQYFADTVKVYMKTLRNVPKQTITRLDRIFFKSHPKNKFEMTAPVEITTKEGIVTAIIIGKEYLDGTSFKYERIEIKFDRNRKINYFRAATLR
ncbi:MAG TPA: hypothetical protein VGO58_14175 [Chitinophagaceae bacterium]|jgi:hypothetical protein|nr:hypothetical protein [Chitinophagaceae bacterium]